MREAAIRLRVDKDGDLDRAALEDLISRKPEEVAAHLGQFTGEELKPPAHLHRAKQAHRTKK